MIKTKIVSEEKRFKPFEIELKDINMDSNYLVNKNQLKIFIY